MALPFILAGVLVASVLLKNKPKSKPPKLLLPPLPPRKSRLREKLKTTLSLIVRKERPFMPQREHPAFLDEREHDLEGQEERPHKNGEPPAVRAPQTIGRPQSRPGFWSNLFDPKRRITDQHENERYKIYQETVTAIYRTKAEVAKQKAQISGAAGIVDHRHKATQWAKTTALKNEGTALCVQQEDFNELLERVARLDLDPYLQEQLTTELFDVYFGGRNGKRRDDEDDDENNQA